MSNAAIAASKSASWFGGGNLFRGRLASELGMTEATAHYAGMLATVINGLALQDAIEATGCEVRTMSALQVRQVAEIFIRRRAIRHLEKGRIVLCVGGTGNPYVTTDTAAALRGIELDADQLLMGKHGTDGVYTADPACIPTPSVTHDSIIGRRCSRILAC